jgi:2-methylcitrate dehydratase PrpD
MAAPAHETPALEALTKRFAAHMAGLTIDDLPSEVVEKAKLILRDGVGNQLAASAISEPARRMVELVREWGGAEESTIVGYGLRVPTPHAALCNAMMGHGVELDDAHGTGLIKAGSVLVPSLFAVAERADASGADVLTALVGAYDIAIRIAKAINPAHRQRGYHTTGTVSTIGAAAAAAKLLGADADAIASAIGLAAMQAAGIQSYLDDPCMAKPFSPGKAAFNGVLAGIMASRGFTGPKKALESKEGFFNAFTESVRVEDLEGIGKHFAIMEVGFKPHAACRYAHGPIDLALRAYHEDGVRLGNVDAVTVQMSELAIRQASKPAPSNLNAAMGSTQFSVALALALGGNGLKEYWDGYKMPEVHDGAKRVQLQPEPAFGLGGRQAVVEIRLRDGQVVRHRSEEPKGEPANPLTPQELERKFLAMTTMVVDEGHARRLGDMVMGIEGLDRASAIPRATVVENGPALRAA